MKSPVCGTAKLGEIQFEAKLTALHCPRCNGHWIPSENYWQWIKEHGKALPENPASFYSVPEADTQKALLCPECGRILQKYRLGPDIKFRLDHCGACGGVWFDRAEWEVLKDRCLHDHLHEFFTDAWQKKIRADQARERAIAIYREKFGPEDYEKILGLKNWIEAHPLKRALMDFLTDPDPFE